jgi:hypothetical protein
MSQWNETKKEDLEVDGDEINVYLGSDYSGNIYTTIKIKDLLEILAEQAIWTNKK